MIGVFFGALPGAGGVISSFTSYAIAKAWSKPEEQYGEGAEGGVVATESANNATVGGTLVPTLALGIPGDASSAMLLGALLILGFVPGTALFTQQPEIVGILFRASNMPLSPIIIGLILGPILENNLRRALLNSRDGFWFFWIVQFPLYWCALMRY